MGAASSLDDPAVGRDLISSVDREGEAREGSRTGERLDVKPRGARRVLGCLRGGDAPELEVALGEGSDEKLRGRARSETHGHPVLYERRRCLGGEALLPLDVRAHVTATL